MAVDLDMGEVILLIEGLDMVVDKKRGSLSIGDPEPAATPEEIDRAKSLRDKMHDTRRKLSGYG